MNVADRKGEILEKSHKEEIQRLVREHEEERRRLQEENANLKGERNRFRQELAAVRAEKAALEAKLDEANCSISDLKFDYRRNASPSVPPGTNNAPTLASANTNNVGTSQPRKENFTDATSSNSGFIRTSPNAEYEPTPELEVGGSLVPNASLSSPQDLPPPSFDAEPPQPCPESDNEIEFVGMTFVPSNNPDVLVKSEIGATSPSTLRSVCSDNSESRGSSLSSLTPFTLSTPGPSRLTVPVEPLKIKKEALLLPQQVVSNFLSGIDTFNISPGLVPTPVSRRFLRETYGGSDQQFISFMPRIRDPGPSTSLHPKGRPIVFPEPELNPEIPHEPGAPGLIFASRFEILEHPPWTVFRKVSGSSSPVVWTYLGEYENEVCGKMTAEQFQQQRPEVKERWGGLIVKAKVCTAYVAMRARIGLRKAHPEKPIREQDVEREMIKIKKKSNPISVLVNDVIKSFCDGDEGVDIIRMKCVGYDRTFADQIAQSYKTWQKQPRASTGDGGQKPVAGKRGKRKRPPETSPTRRAAGEGDSTRPVRKRGRPSKVALAEESSGDDDDGNDDFNRGDADMGGNSDSDYRD